MSSALVRQRNEEDAQPDQRCDVDERGGPEDNAAKATASIVHHQMPT